MRIAIVPVALAWLAAAAFGEDWSPKRAAEYLDARQREWFAWPSATSNGVPCMSCHTGVPYLLARPALRRVMGETTPTEFEKGLLDGVRARADRTTPKAFFPALPESPRTTDNFGSQLVLAALALALDDNARGSGLTPEAEQALDRLWSTQIRSGPGAGTWHWTRVSLDPWETDDSPFYGAVLSALATGLAPGNYAARPGIRDNIAALTAYLRNGQAAQPLHNRLTLLWASTKLDGLLTEAERQPITAEAWRKQQPDGGWTIESLGPWMAHPNAPPSEGSNNYATGVAAFLLQQAGVERSDPRLARALHWLAARQDRETGAWFADSMNKGYKPGSMQERFMRDAATGFAVAALLAGSSESTPTDDSAIARWVIRQGGAVRLAGAVASIRDLPDLPAGNIRLEGIDLTGTLIQASDLERLSGLAHLEELLLPAQMWNPNAGSRVEANDSFAHLKGLQGLRRLHISLHFLTTINIQDKGIAHLAPLSGLRELRLAQTRIAGKTLAPLTGLRSLDVSYASFTDDGMKSLTGMHELERLILRDTHVTDSGLESIAGLRNLVELDLDGARISDRGLENLRGLRKLRKLNLLGAAVTDAGLDVIADLTELVELNLYRTQVTNAGLVKLRGLKKLASLDLRYSRATSAGVAGLRAVIPGCQVAFLESSSARREATPPRTLDQQGIESWIASIGGRILRRGGRVSEVDLSRTPVTDAQIEWLAKLDGLESLDLSSTEIGDAAALALSKLSGLISLNLSHTAVSDTGLARLATLGSLVRLSLNHTLARGIALSGLGSLRALEMAGALVTDEGAIAIGRLAGLERLRLSYTDISDDGLQPLKSLTRLRALDLTGTDVGDRGMAVLAGMASLEELHLGYTRFTDKGLANLASLGQLRTLDLARTRATDKGVALLAGLTGLLRLNLDYTAVTDTGLASLRQMTGLTELRLDTAAVTDAGIETLHSLAGLKTLNLYHTLVTEKGQIAFKAALPECRVIWERNSSLPNRRGS